MGPDRERVKALARIESWEGREARLWIEREFLPTKESDVLADLHTWEAARENIVQRLSLKLFVRVFSFPEKGEGAQPESFSDEDLMELLE